MNKKINKFENKIKYKFNSKSNILLAFSHSSFTNENKDKKLQSNERLEFLGDSILNLLITEYLYFNYPNLSEGELTKARANIVCESSLFNCANNINIGEYLFLGKGEELTGGRSRPSILSDCFECVVGAIFIDGGIENARKFIINQMKSLIEDSATGSMFIDYKTELQEIIQRNNKNTIVYEIVDMKGPDHDKMFMCQVKVCDSVLGNGEGKTKKESEQSAAKSVLLKEKT